MNMKKYQITLVFIAGIIALLSFITLTAVMYGSTSLYVYFNISDRLFASYTSNHLGNIISYSVLATLMLLSAAYAFSVLGYIRRLPYSEEMLRVFSTFSLSLVLAHIVSIYNKSDLPNAILAVKIIMIVLFFIACIGFREGSRLTYTIQDQ
jgi:hypothetical protein